MVRRPKVSVIMLTYNREALVGRAIQSVLNQALTEFEFIIVDNGSTDGSGYICDGYAKRDARIEVIHRQRGNIGSGRNVGLDAATGEYAAFIDDDDFCLPDFLSFLYELAEMNGADLAVCGSYKEENGIRRPNGIYMYKERYLMEPAEAVENYLCRKLYNCAMPMKLIKRQLYQKVRFPEYGVYDDISTAYKYFTLAHRIVADGHPKYVFYRHAGNNSSAATKHELLNPVQLCEYIVAFQDRTKYIEGTLPALVPLARYSEWSYMLSMIEHCRETEKRMKDEIKKNLDEFLNGGFILDFEKDWVRKYITEEF